MSNMVEIDIDFDYCGEVEMVLAHDECGEHEDVEFYRNDLLARDNAKLQSAAAKAWQLFVDYGSTHPCDLPRVDAVRNELLDLGIEVGQ